MAEDYEIKDEVMEEGDGDNEGQGDQKKKKVYIPGVSRPLKEDEEWDYDPSAYRIYHTFETTRPCLSFDIITDSLGNNRSEFPLMCYLAAGSQADRPKDNEISIMRLSNIHGTKNEELEDNESDDEDEEEEEKKDPKFHAAIIPHFGGVNRLKCEALGPSSVCAIWNDQGKVQIWNLSSSIQEVDNLSQDDKAKTNEVKMPKEKPLYSFVGHGTEGFSLGWSPLKLGTLASGDRRSKIFIWHMGEGGQWAVDQRPYDKHEASVEDLQWSPTEESLLVSCSVDRTIRLWDTRARPTEACVHTVENAHDKDINVLSWNKFDPLLVTGSDDAEIKVWSLKTIQYNEPVARFKHHKGPITSVEWNPIETTTLMASGEDDQTTIWDLAVEAEPGQEDLSDVPPQLLFVHMGQKEVKEVHWHKQIPGLAMTTALTGFNLFRTINI